MAKFNYDKTAATAQRLIDKFGRTLVLKQLAPGTGPEHNPGPGVETPYNITAAVLKAKQGTLNAFDNQLVNGTLIEENLRSLLIAAKGLAVIPKSTDTVEFDGSTWSILGVTPLKPADVTVIYTASVRRIG